MSNDAVKPVSTNWHGRHGGSLRRWPNLRLDEADHPYWRPTFVLRGLNKLPAGWKV